MLLVTESTFARRVLRAELPVLVCFGTRACPGRRALLPALEAAAAAHAGSLLVAMALVDQAPLLVEQCGVAASPTLMLFAGGERQAQVVGFIAPGLVELFAAAAAAGAAAGDIFWSPVEERFEDAVLIPLLAGWGLSVERQVACALPGRNRAQRGRIDLLVAARPGGPPLTLIESKRQIRGEQELRLAAGQAHAYALSLGLPGFIVAAPRGLWVFRCDSAGFACARRFSSLELHQEPERVRRLIAPL